MTYNSGLSWRLRFLCATRLHLRQKRGVREGGLTPNREEHTFPHHSSAGSK